MPISPTTIPLISAGADVLSSGINAVVQSEQNRKNRQFAEYQARQARQWALDDYQMQNQYNSPAEQMKRLREAGLNPNLVYGNGATATGGAVRSSSPASWEGKAPQVQLGDVVGKYLNAQTTQLQHDNLTAQNAVLLEQAKNIAQDTLNKKIGYSGKEFDLNFKIDSRNLDLYRKEQTNVNLYQDMLSKILGRDLTSAQIANTKERTATDVATRQPRVNQIIQSTSESVQRVLNMRLQAAKTQAETSYVLTQIENAQKDGKLKQLEINLKRLGMTWSDPLWQRKAAQLLDAIGL